MDNNLENKFTEQEIRKIFDKEYCQKLKKEGENDRIKQLWKKREELLQLIKNRKLSVKDKLFTWLVKDGDEHCKYSLWKSYWEVLYRYRMTDVIVQLLREDSNMKSINYTLLFRIEASKWSSDYAKQFHRQTGQAVYVSEDEVTYWCSIIDALFKQGNVVFKRKLCQIIDKFPYLEQTINWGDYVFECLIKYGDMDNILIILKNELVSEHVLDVLFKKLNKEKEKFSTEVLEKCFKIENNLIWSSRIPCSVAEWYIEQNGMWFCRLYEKNPNFRKKLEKFEFKEETWYKILYMIWDHDEYTVASYALEVAFHMLKNPTISGDVIFYLAERVIQSSEYSKDEQKNIVREAIKHKNMRGENYELLSGWLRTEIDKEMYCSDLPRDREIFKRSEIVSVNALMRRLPITTSQLI